ncbi:MAG: hypothetical protein WKF78_07840 [Candidatus Limnocylindrales bacterium]
MRPGGYFRAARCSGFAPRAAVAPAVHRRVSVRRRAAGRRLPGDRVAVVESAATSRPRRPRSRQRPTTNGASTPAPSTDPLAAASAPAVVGGPATAIDVDPGLLARLPVAIDGVPLNADPDTAAEIAADPGLRSSVRSVAVAHAFGPVASAAASDPTASGSAGDYVVVTVVRLRSGVFDAPFYRAWRDSFDQGVCAQAGGVAGHAEASIAGRTVSIGSCAGGVHTYHVYLPAQEILVSLQAMGPGRYGELVAAGLRE